MAKANLPVNFKDDILKENMNGKRRFNMIQNNDGTVSFEDVTDYTQVGSTFGAAQINATNEAVNNAADASKIIDSLETIKANTQSGYIAGALAVKELSSNLGNNTIIDKWAAGTWNATTNYAKTLTMSKSGTLVIAITYACYGIDGAWDQYLSNVSVKKNDISCSYEKVTSAYTMLLVYTIKVSTNDVIKISAPFNKISCSESAVIILS